MVVPRPGSVLFMRNSWTGSVRGCFVVHAKRSGAEIQYEQHIRRRPNNQCKFSRGFRRGR